jgi:hypothetical protein
MTKLSPEKLVRYLDNLHRLVSMNMAAPASGLDVRTVTRWRHASEDGAEEFANVTYRGITQSFHEHIQDEIEQSVGEIESDLRGAARSGRLTPQTYKGDRCYEDDEEAIAADEKSFKEGVELGLFWPDKKKRIRNPSTGVFERVPLMMWQPPSVEQQMAVLRAWGGKYQDKRSVDVNMNGNVNLGVTVAGGIGGPPRPAVAPPLKQLEIVEAITEATFAEVVDEVTADDDEPAPEGVFTTEQEQILERSRSSNALVRDLANKALERQNRTANPDTDIRRTGPGVVPPGGYKAV